MLEAMTQVKEQKFKFRELLFKEQETIVCRLSQ